MINSLAFGDLNRIVKLSGQDLTVRFGRLCLDSNLH